MAKHFKATKKGVMLNLPLVLTEKMLPGKPFFTRLTTHEGKDIIAIKPCIYNYKPEQKQFVVEFVSNAVLWNFPYYEFFSTATGQAKHALAQFDKLIP